jgi:hypothetical protein
MPASDLTPALAKSMDLVYRALERINMQQPCDYCKDTNPDNAAVAWLWITKYPFIIIVCEWHAHELGLI